MKLEPCPFCGDEAKVIGNAENNSGFFVMCFRGGGQCGCQLGSHYENGLPYHRFRTMDEAAKAWNKRIVDSQPEWLSQALNEGDGSYKP